MAMFILVFAILLQFQVSTSYKLLMTPDQASKISRRDVSDEHFSQGNFGNFIGKPVKVPKVVPNSEKRVAASRSIEDIKRELTKVMRELHEASDTLQHHSILPKSHKRNQGLVLPKNEKRTSSDTNDVSVKSSVIQNEHQRRTADNNAKRLSEKSKRMEELERIADDLINDLNPEKDIAKKTVAHNEDNHGDLQNLQNDITRLSQLSQDLKRSSASDNERKLSHIAQELHEIRENEKKGSDSSDSSDSLTSLLSSLDIHSKRSSDDGPKLSYIGREVDAESSLRELLNAAKNEKRQKITQLGRSVGASHEEHKDPPMIIMDNDKLKSREATILAAVEHLMEMKRKRVADAEENAIKTRTTKMVNDISKLLTKRKFSLYKKSALGMTNGNSGNRADELIGDRDAMTAYHDRLLRLMEMYLEALKSTKSSSNQRSLGRIKKAMREIFQVDASRFTHNSSGKDAGSAGQKSGNKSGNKNSIIADLKRLLAKYSGKTAN